MDIGLLSMAMSQNYVKQQASIALMKQTMDMAQEQSEALQKLMASIDVSAIQHAAQPHLGGNIDITL